MGCIGSCRRIRRAFTVIEKLTTLTVMAVLLSLMAPSLRDARQKGCIAKCQANIRETTLATLSYVNQNNDTFPLSGDCVDSDCYFWNGHQYLGWNGTQLNQLDRIWARPLNREFGIDPSPQEQSVARIARCPSDTGAPGETGSNESLYVTLGSSYALNPILCQGAHADWKYRETQLGLNGVINPAKKVLAFDHTAFGLTYAGDWTATRPGWHDRKQPAGVVGYIDCHVEYETGRGAVREWQWYGEASGPNYVQNLSQKVAWPVLEGCE
jgi:type II secretory pathway pseudopilin PulG